MSYCRFSADNWRSDIYAYQSDDGCVLHVAANRIVGKIPVVGRYPFDGDKAARDDWFAAHEKQIAVVEVAARTPIGGPHDGKSWVFETPEELINKLHELAAAGYHVPASAFEAIDWDLEGADG